MLLPQFFSVATLDRQLIVAKPVSRRQLCVRVQSEAAAAEHDRDPDADLARVFRDRETRTEDGDSEGRVDRGEQHPQPRAIAQQRMGIQADRAYSLSSC